ncbi:ATP-grasp domain-containing protein [Tumebacillus sp. BK434]|uniref:ATP-grasp domain-containing protein n=1 Tax=Tumebacillus sp. BK434 TaxID=2512169 RepID=UPI00104BA13B|nr:ATP-grasp domain-containing protein [Tumebacillus sp. BK434]TCP58015.1 ATP-grasp domain-containing protein [Tumebacillus sp. BK434]
MAILLLNRFARDKIDYAEWLTGLEEEVYMFAERSVVDDFPEFPVRQPFDVLMRDGRVELEAVKLHRERPFRRIIALEESEIIRAGRLRDRLGLAGQGYASALAFRDKAVMKETAMRGGIPVAAHRKLESALDLYDFAEAHGYPIVVKPLRGMSSSYTRVLRSEDELKEWVKTGAAAGMLAESFVAGDMYQIDGVVLDGAVQFACASAYVNTCLAYTDQQGVGNVLLEPGHPLYERLIHFANELLRVMPKLDAATFHAEVFHTPDDRIVLCEVASRTTGGRVNELIERAYGLHLDRYITRAQCGLIDPLPDPQGAETLYGSYFIPPKHGKLVSMPAAVPFDWCVEASTEGEIGKIYAGPTRSTESYMTVIVSGQTAAEVTARLTQAIQYVEANTVWEA